MGWGITTRIESRSYNRISGVIKVYADGVLLDEWEGIQGNTGIMQGKDIGQKAMVYMLHTATTIKFEVMPGTKLNKIGLWSDRPSYYATNNPSGYQITFDTATNDIEKGFDYQNDQQ